MTKLAILSEKERTLFNSPPKFNPSQRLTYFALEQNVSELLQSIRITTNKVGFILQYGYFKSHGKFYPATQFRQHDIDCIIQGLNLDFKEVNIENYQKSIASEHRRKILWCLKWKPLNQKELNKLFVYILSQAQNQISPRKLFDIAIDYCWHNKIEVPSYNQLASLITDAYNKNESSLINNTKDLLTDNSKEKLDLLVNVNTEQKSKYQRSTINTLKQVNQSLRRPCCRNIEIC